MSAETNQTHFYGHEYDHGNNRVYKGVQKTAQDIVDSGRQVVDGGVDRERSVSDRVQSRADHVEDKVGEEARETRGRLMDAYRDQRSDMKDLGAFLSESDRDLTRDLRDGFAAQIRQACDNTAALTRDAVSNFKDLLINQHAMQAEMSAKMAECCCEIKALVIKEGAAGRDLSRQIEQERTARELVTAQHEVLFLRTQAAR